MAEDRRSGEAHDRESHTEGCRVVHGHIVPTAEALTKVAKQLVKDLKVDPVLEARFKKEPRLVLGERGISIDGQIEVLKEMKRPRAVGRARCSITCIVTNGCMITI